MKIYILLFLVIFGFAAYAVQAQEVGINETLELLSQQKGELPTAKEWNAYVKLQEDQRDLSAEFRDIVSTSESLAVSSMALELMRQRGEIEESDIPMIKDYTRRSYSNLLSQEDEYGNDRLDHANKVFTGLRALTAFEGSKFEEDFIIDFISSDERLVRGSAAKILSKHGSEKSVEALQAALDKMPPDARYRAQLEGSLKLLRERLASEAIEETVSKIPATPSAPEVVEVAQEVTQPEPSKEEPAEVVAVETPEQPSQWWLWLIGAVVVVGGIGLIARRKS
jgi:hypothetical protein